LVVAVVRLVTAVVVVGLAVYCQLLRLIFHLVLQLLLLVQVV
jgi:hypothetical protein